MPTHPLRGVSLHYHDSGSGRPAALIHGFPLDWRMWEQQMPKLSERFRVIAPDLRGFGRSVCSEPFTIESLADDLHLLLGKLDALPCTLCGFSMGGYVSLAFAAKYPSHLSALVLVDTRSEADSPEGKANRNTMIELVRRGGPEAIADHMIPKLLWDQTLRSRPEVPQRVREMIRSCPALTIEHALVAMRDRQDYTQMLSSITVPTLIVVGEHDALTPPQMSRAIHQRIAGSSLAIIPGAGHMAPMEQPGLVQQHLAQFLGGVEAR